MAITETSLPADADLGLHPERRGPFEAAEFERMPQEPERPMELIGGWVVAMSPIGFSSGSLIRDLTVLLDPLAKGRGWCLTLDTRHRPSLPPQTVLFPDLALHCVPDGEVELDGETVLRTPELVIEVLGEETAERDRAPRGAKFLAYQLSGVAEYFYTWPDGREASGFRLEDGVYAQLAADRQGFFASRVLGAGLRLVPAALGQPDPSRG